MPLFSFRVKDYLNCSKKNFTLPLPPSPFHAPKLKKFWKFVLCIKSCVLPPLFIYCEHLP